MDGFEPLVTSPGEINRLAPLLKKHGLEMRSLYVNSTLYETGEIEKSTASVLAIAEKAKPLGTRIIVTNPSPIRWGGPENKSDAELRIQADALDKLGIALKAAGLVLAYHNHDIELRNAAREFHHMMLGTDPANVTFCLDCPLGLPRRGRLVGGLVRRAQALRPPRSPSCTCGNRSAASGARRFGGRHRLLPGREVACSSSA